MIRSFVFSQGKLMSQDVGFDLLRQFLFDEGVHLWVDVEDASEAERKQLLEEVFSFHPLAIEDCIAATERPKVDDYDTYIFLVTHAVNYHAGQHEFQTTELNMFVGKNFLVTVHDAPLRSITKVIERVQRNAPMVARAPDRLTYNILDALLDNYAPALDEMAREIAAIEEKVLRDPSVDILEDVLHFKTEVYRVRQIVSPQREMIARIARGEFKIVRAHLLPYYRDLLDHLSRIGDTADSYRDTLTNALQVHLNIQQMQINRVIKVLTVLATLSMPMMIVTSFYGMNINHVPNTEGATWWVDYLIIFAMTGAITAGITWFLKHKRWM